MLPIRPIQRALLLPVACCACTTPTAHAAAPTATLHYHFLNGQFLTYHLTASGSERVTISGLPETSITFGTPVLNGRQFGIADAPLVAKTHLELQCEVRAAIRGGRTDALIGIASPGAADGSVRVSAFAREEERVQQILDAVRITR